MTAGATSTAELSGGSWRGEDLDALMAVLAGAPAEAEPLALHLYQEWYLGTRPEHVDGPLTAFEVQPAQALTAAHAGSSRFRDGWVARRVSSSGRVEAAQADKARVVGPGEYVCRSHPGRRPRPGDAVALPTALTSVEDGWWVARTTDGLAPDIPLTRLYVNPHPGSTPAAVAVLTATLEDWGGSYAVKASLQLYRVRRPDGIVVYVPRAEFHGGLRSRVDAVSLRLADLDLLRPEVPRLTARLAPGVAAADAPADGGSFGMDRCRLVAEAIASLSQDARITPVVAAAVTQTFAAAGLDVSRPYLAPGAGHDDLDAR